MKHLISVLGMALMVSGCTPLISNVVMQGCGEEKVTMSNKADADQTNTPTTSAAVPVSVGASPVSSGTVHK